MIHQAVMSGDGDTGQWTVLGLINWTCGYFDRAGIEQARLSAEVLLAHVLDCRRVALYTRFDRQADSEQLAAFRQLVRRASEGEPIAYLVGRKEFYSLAMKVTPDVLIPRPETELLVDIVLDYARRRRGAFRLWDVCTGSGCVAVAAARQCRELTVLATDVSDRALAVADENARAHGVDERVRLERADLLGLPESARSLAPFDVITANPPYVCDAQMAELPDQVKREPALALRAGQAGLEFIAPIFRTAGDYLAAGGTVAVEIGMGQAERVGELIDKAGRYDQPRFLKDGAGIERVALARSIAD